MLCRICDRRGVMQRTALEQLGAHPGLGHIWPQCRGCQDKIDEHVSGIQAALAAKKAAAEGAEQEGW